MSSTSTYMLKRSVSRQTLTQTLTPQQQEKLQLLLQSLQNDNTSQRIDNTSGVFLMSLYDGLALPPPKPPTKIDDVDGS